MLGHLIHQPLKNRRGVSLIELFLALAMAILLILVLAGLFQAQLKSYGYAVRQTDILANARQALDAGSSKPGMGTEARAALFSTGLSTAQLSLNTPGGVTAQYTLSGTDLLLTQSTQTLKLARNMTAVQIAYYNMNTSGLIMISTQAASASLVTAWVQNQQAGQKTYTFYSGGRLRNHP
jgi:hypothetical protein